MNVSGQQRTLPIRVPPLPGEPFDSWLEASCRRLGITVPALLSVLGICGDNHTLPDHTVCLHAAEAHHVAQATGVGVARLHAMTLRVFDGHALQLAPQPRRAVMRSAWWARGSGSRYCPACLAERGGRWRLRWRLSWVFACTDHNVVLHDTCPGCGHIPRRTVAAGSGLRPLAICPGQTTQGRTCGVDLCTIEPRRLAAGDRLLATQDWINGLLTAIETGTDTAGQPPVPPAPAVVFADLAAVANWLLRHVSDDDVLGYGPHVQHAWQAYRDQPANSRDRTRPRPHPPPLDAALMGAITTRAMALVTGNTDDSEQHAISQLRVLVRRRGHRSICPRGLAPQQWARLSDPVRGRFLRALDPELPSVDRIRCRSCTPLARLPDTSIDLQATARAGRIPQLLWPEWTIRLLPAPAPASVSTGSAACSRHACCCPATPTAPSARSPPTCTPTCTPTCAYGLLPP